jgi:hypothetical protein
MSVVGFDNHPMASYFGLTTVAQDVAEQGRMIARHLVRSTQGNGTKSVRLHAATHLIVRSTTGAPTRRTARAILAGRQPAVAGAKGESRRRSSRPARANGHDPLTRPPMARPAAPKRLVTTKKKKGATQI